MSWFVESRELLDTGSPYEERKPSVIERKKERSRFLDGEWITDQKKDVWMHLLKVIIYGCLDEILKDARLRSVVVSDSDDEALKKYFVKNGESEVSTLVYVETDGCNVIRACGISTSLTKSIDILPNLLGFCAFSHITRPKLATWTEVECTRCELTTTTPSSGSGSGSGILDDKATKSRSIEESNDGSDNTNEDHDSSGSESASGILDEKATKSKSIEEWGGVVVETFDCTRGRSRLVKFSDSSSIHDMSRFVESLELLDTGSPYEESKPSVKENCISKAPDDPCGGVDNDIEAQFFLCVELRRFVPRKNAIKVIWGANQPPPIFNHTLNFSITVHQTKRCGVDLMPSLQTRQRRESKSIPRASKFERVGNQSLRNVYEWMFILIGRVLFHFTLSMVETNMIMSPRSRLTPGKNIRISYFSSLRQRLVLEKPQDESNASVLYISGIERAPALSGRKHSKRGTPRNNIGSTHIGIIGSTSGGSLEINVEIPRTETVRIKRLLDDFEVTAVKVRVTDAKQNLVMFSNLNEKYDNGNAPLITQVVEGVETIIAPTTAKEKAQRRYVVPTGRVIVSTSRKVQMQILVYEVETVFQNGNNIKRIGRDRNGRVIILPLTTAEEHIAIQRESKARITLLQSIPDDHVADFHYMDDGKDIWNAVKDRFGGNAESKKMRKSILKQEFLEFRIGKAEGLHKGYDRMQEILSQLNQLKAKPEDENINLKFLRALPSSWSQVDLALKTKGGLELLSFDVLYYKLKTLEVDVKGYTTFSSSQSARQSHSAFTGSHRSGNVIEDVLQSFVIDTELKQQLTYKDFKQIEKLDLEEMDLKWQMAKLFESARFNKKKVRCYKCQQRGHFAREFKAKGGNDKQRYSSFKIKEIGKKEEDSKALIIVDTLVDWTDHNSESDGVIAAKEFGMIAGCDSEDAIKEGAAKIYNLITRADTEEASTAYDTGEFALMGVTFDVHNCPFGCDDKTKVGLGFNSCIRENELGLDDSAFSVFTTNSEDVEGIPLFNRFAKANSMKVVPPPLSGDYTSLSDHIDLDESQMSYGTKSSTSCDSKSMSNNFVSCNDSDKSLEVNTNDFASCDSSFKSSKPKPNNTTSCASTSSENPFSAAQDEGIFDSDYSRSMIGNKETLDDFQAFQGGKVTFGGGEGRITGKGTIRTPTLDFENVYYVKELQQFNLFSISQICDKKNRVLFTDTECLVLSKDFKLLDDSMVVLKVPRKHNLYTINLNDLCHRGNLACLAAHASFDKSVKWHRRMGHVNYKNMNRLVNGNLVRGLPPKLFKYDHTCVACCKGKQQKASYKAIHAVSSISELLQLLHMDLFGPTSIRSIDHKCYSLVITNDYSRFCWVFFLEHKDETYPILKDFINLVENQLNKKVLGTTPHNKTPYTLLTGNIPSVSPFKPFGCHVTILNISDHLGKFDGKADEGYIIGYSASNKAYKGLGHEWYFDLDYLTDTLGYKHVQANQSVETQGDATNPAGTQDADLDSDCDKQVIIIPSYPSHNIHRSKPKDTPDDEVEELETQANVKTVLPGCIPVPTGSILVPAGDKMVYTDDVPIHPSSSTGSFFGDEPTTRFPCPSDLGNHDPSPGIFSSSFYDDEFGTTLNNVASNMERDNHTDFQHCLFACFLSQVKPRSVAQALEDPSWVDTIQEEMQQFKFQNVWVLVDFPGGKYAIGTKWIDWWLFNPFNP
nr:putative ribonuclease H-like domain-containing protein [Tanacetum cinerariifolium]